ncbi:hypothetical protein [Lactiplantibacillus mudanjiangensis]|uniref:Uncharacterized protein n=1 Tax=Lactiplantibacillus mudanjiangensis TaxID=1296538 RepID=A0A660E7D8_9LACO|nr:hypothetical protein [Lactiplantibacillus mudanjiangensis]VDG17829.1 hypothetical protein MUDAN_BIHEEGNE_00353 [Lactiplantibacillus mudanjiangensis]VDG23275.1 hypothetical protein MUDAN_IGPPGNFN_01891 [Lactiplantibacillus mudanjiangensis]VDG28236.1 hypothetical protein MUDAN_MDHGFNIF_00433 [Lactiplantibacillus mudanjiangensis]VDG32473.1 hypothetical protein MUDAN_DOGOELCO_01730 [Lactiplantibacillus mudanjiangensis]
MLLDQDMKIKNIIAAQIIKVFYPFVIAKTETGDYLKLNLSATEQADPLFWDELRSILKARLWVPIGKHYHQLLDDGWLVNTPQVAN